MTARYELNLHGVTGPEVYTAPCVLQYLCDIVNENREWFSDALNSKTDPIGGVDTTWLRAAHWETLVAAQAIAAGEPWVRWESEDALRLGLLFGIAGRVSLEATELLYNVSALIYHNRVALFARLGKDAEEIRYARLAEAICIAEILIEASGEMVEKKDKDKVRRMGAVWSAKANRRKSHYIAMETRRTKAA